MRSFADCQFEHPKAQQHTIICDYITHTDEMYRTLKKDGIHQHGGCHIKWHHNQECSISNPVIQRAVQPCVIGRCT